jgi:hypothetical protein
VLRTTSGARLHGNPRLGSDPVLRFLALLDATAPPTRAEPVAAPGGDKNNDKRAMKNERALPSVLTTPGPQPTLESGTKTKATAPQTPATPSGDDR